MSIDSNVSNYTIMLENWIYWVKWDKNLSFTDISIPKIYRGILNYSVWYISIYLRNFVIQTRK